MHRDYSREDTDIELSLYADCLEIISPVGLPNGVTIEKMKMGIVRTIRNNLLKNILRDYGYVEHLGMGVRDKIVRSMLRHSGREPEFDDKYERFKVCLWGSTDLFNRAVEKRILHRQKGVYTIPIPFMRTWLISKYARERIVPHAPQLSSPLFHERSSVIKSTEL